MKKGKKFELSEKDIYILTGEKKLYNTRMAVLAVRALVGVALTGVSIGLGVADPDIGAEAAVPALIGAAVSYSAISLMIRSYKIKSGLESGEIKESDIKRR